MRAAPVESVKRWPIGKLLPYARNPKTHPPEQVALIAKSMEQFGQAQIILIDGDEGEAKGEVIAGHGRVLAAEKLGWTELVVGEARGWSEDEKRAYRIADNELAASPWDMALLKLEVHDLALKEFDLQLLGFGSKQLDELSADFIVPFPTLPSGERQPFQQVTFTLHDSQVTVLRDALSASRAMGPFSGPNENSNGNALARICEVFLVSHGGKRKANTRRADKSKGRNRAGKARALQPQRHAK